MKSKKQCGNGHAVAVFVFALLLVALGSYAVYKLRAMKASTPPAPKPVEPPGLSLETLEQLALQRNPTLAQAAAQVQASRGKALQAGLWCNPNVGYVGDQMGIAGTAGEMQGGYVQQMIITAGKLRLSRAKYRQEAYEAELLATAQQLRVAFEILRVAAEHTDHEIADVVADSDIFVEPAAIHHCKQLTAEDFRVVPQGVPIAGQQVARHGARAHNGAHRAHRRDVDRSRD